MNMNQVLETIKARRSVRTYTERQVSEEDLKLILEAGAYAPNGMHYETWHFTAVQNNLLLRTLNELLKSLYRDSDNLYTVERGNSETYCFYYNAPTLVIVSNEPTYSWAGQDCACALENMFLAARSLGIDSCWINQLKAVSDDPDMHAYLTELGMPDNHRVYGCAALGYAPVDAPLKEKKLKEGTITIVR